MEKVRYKFSLWHILGGVAIIVVQTCSLMAWHQSKIDTIHGGIDQQFEEVEDGIHGLSNRLTATETDAANTAKALERIEHKVDHLVLELITNGG